MHHYALTLLAVLAPSISYASLIKRGPSPVAAPAPGWSYIGCWTDSVSARSLDSDFIRSSGLIVEDCVSYCSGKNYTVAGVEYGSECYCGFNLKSSSKKETDDSQCQTPCGGSATEACGGSNHLSVYTNGSPGGVNKPLVNSYSYVGCYTDSPSSRGLTHISFNDQSSQVMTVELCTSSCSNAGYKYAGLEYGGECYCDNTLANSSTVVKGTPQDTGCDYLCNGDSTEWCGGKGRLTLYSNAPTQPAEQLNCPSFESCTWTNNAGSTLGFSFPQGSSAHTGSFYASPHKGSFFATSNGRSCSSGCTSADTACIATYPYLSAAGAYRLSFYAGGINNFKQDPRCAPNCAPPAYSLTYTASLISGAGTAQFSGAVGYTGGSGPGLYGSYGAFDIANASSYQTLQLCFTWTGTRRGSDDTLFVDDVSLFGPY